MDTKSTLTHERNTTDVYLLYCIVHMVHILYTHVWRRWLGVCACVHVFTQTKTEF